MEEGQSDFRIIQRRTSANQAVNRKLLMLGSTVQIAALFAMGGLGVQTPVSDARKTGIVATMTIFGAGFALGWAALTYVVTAEIIPLRLRDNGQRVASLINILMK